MVPRRGWIPGAVAALLSVVVLLPVRADTPPAPWSFQDIGDQLGIGTTEVDSATGVWSVKGSGLDIWGNADTQHFAYQRVTGDASITARILGVSGGGGWAKTGLMIRENLSPGSPNLNYMMTGGGLHTTARFIQDHGSTPFHDFVGPFTSRRNNVLMRLQRVGQQVVGFYSTDGQIWRQAAFSSQTFPSLPAEALLGLSVTSENMERVATARFNQVAVLPGAVSPYDIQAIAGDRTVTLQWREPPGSLGVRISRGPDNATADKFVPLADQRVVGGTYTDSSEGLVNNTPVNYLLVPIFPAADGGERQGLPVAVRATPIAAPPGFTGTSINEPIRSGSAAFSPDTQEVTIRSSGTDIWQSGDQCYFLHRQMAGDGRITVKALTKPTGASPWAKAGLMIRESLHGSARTAYLVLTPGNGLAFQFRGEKSGASDWFWPSVPDERALKAPITIRLTRQGRTLIPEYSLDDGKTFQPAGDTLTFDQDLPPTLYVGLAACVNNVPDQTSTARFTVPVVEPRQ